MAARMWNHGLPALNAARTANCLDPLGRAYDQLDRFARILVLSSNAIEYPGFAPPAHVLMTGPRLDDPGWTEPWTPPAGDDPLVPVGLSSSFMDQAAVLRRIADALGRLPVRGVLTTGPAIEPGAIPAPANVQVVRSAPHREVLRHASAVITHAGHGTTAKALASGVPLLCLPLGRDQHDVAARVVHAGAGRALKASAAPSAIARSLRALLERPAYAEHARRVAGVIAGELTEDRAVAALSAAVR